MSTPIELRERAEAQAASMTDEDLAALPPEEARRLLHDLRVRQIELKLQNEELRRVQAELAASQARYFDLYDLAPVGYLTVSAEGLILEANLRASALFGRERRALAGRPLSHFILSADQDSYYRHRQQLFDTGAPQTCELRLAPRDDSTPITWVRLEAILAQDEERGAPVYRITISDITERKAMEAALRESEELHRITLEHIIAEQKRVKEALQESAERLRLAHKATNDVVWDWDVVQDAHLWNPSGATVFGWTDIVEHPQAVSWWVERIHPDDRQRVAAGLFAVLEDSSRDYWHDEYRFRKADGNYAEAVDRGYVLRDERGRAVRMVGAMLDVTARKVSEKALRESEERYRQLVDHSPDAVAVHRDGIIQFVNPAAVRLMGATHPEQLIGQPAIDFVQPEYHQYATVRIQEALRTGRPAPLAEERFVRLDGTVVDVELVSVPVQYEAATAMLVIIRDIAERKRAEAALREKTEDVERFFDSALDLLCIADTDGYFRRLNRGWEAVLGYPLKELEGHRFLDLVHPEDLPATLDAVARLDAQQTILNFTNRYLCRDGTYRYLEWRAIPHGKLIYAAARDITERRRSEEALRESEERFHRLSQATFEAIVIHERGIVVEANEQLGGMFGYPIAEIAGKPVADFIAPESLDLVMQRIRTGSEEPYELLARRKDGTIFPIEAHARSIPFHGRTVRVTALRDISERKRAERQREAALEALRRYAQQLAVLQETLLEITAQHELPVLLRMIVERAADLLRADGGGLYLCDLDKRQCRCEISYRTLQDYTGTILRYGEGAAGTVAQTGQPLIIDDYRAWSGRAAVFEDRQPFRAMIAMPIIWHEQVTGVIHVLRQETKSFTRADQDLLGMFAGHAAIAIENARLVQGLQHELVEHEEAENRLRATLADLERSNAELEQFAYIASHDLQEPLRMVTSFVQLLSLNYQGQLDADADEFIGYAVDGAKRMQQLILDLLEYSRVGTRGQPPQPTNAGVACQAAIQDLGVAITESGATVTCDPLPTVNADPVQLGQLFMNLIGNAIKFRGAEPPRVHISAHETFEVSKTSKVWEFAVRDNGIGIEPQYFERIFVIFQRLHSREAYPGTGIGLAICKKIVERHGGRIWVESQPGQGSVFYFTLPTA